MSPTRTQLTERDKCFPRVSGDEPAQYPALAAVLGFSPRERG